jgi:hypothetical protein
MTNRSLLVHPRKLHVVTQIDRSPVSTLVPTTCYKTLCITTSALHAARRSCSVFFVSAFVNSHLFRSTKGMSLCSAEISDTRPCLMLSTERHGLSNCIGRSCQNFRSLGHQVIGDFAQSEKARRTFLRCNRRRVQRGWHYS